MNGMIFSALLQKSLLGAYCIGIVLLVRFFLKRISRKYCCWLWMIVFFNLCIQLPLFSTFSLIPQKLSNMNQEKNQSQILDTQQVQTPEDHLEISTEPKDNQTPSISFVSQTPSQETSMTDKEEQTAAPVSLKKSFLIYGEMIWITGVLFMISYSIFSVIKLQHRIRKGNPILYDAQERIYLLENCSPFLWGFFRPAIYLPDTLSQEETGYIIAHELCHRKRKDHLVKPVLYLICMIYWFHPLVWLSYYLCCKDIEIACDEMVIDSAAQNIRKDYVKSLLKYATMENGFLLGPLTFGEPSVKSRIKNILKYKKRGIFATAAAIFITLLVILGLALQPKHEKIQTDPAKTKDQTEEIPEPKEDPQDSDSTDPFAYLTEFLIGKPCADPQSQGWDLEGAIDHRNDFSELPYEPVKGTEDATYLIGKTAHYTLYGKGDYQTMLLCSKDSYAEILHPYTSNYMEPVELYEIDMDQDEQSELAMVLNLKHGTGVSIDSFLLGDFNEEGQLTVYQFTQDDFQGQFSEHLSYQKTETGIQPMLDGMLSGAFVENDPEIAPWDSISAGDVVYFTKDQKQMILVADLMFYYDSNVRIIPEYLGQYFMAEVTWKGGSFHLENCRIEVYGEDPKQSEEQDLVAAQLQVFLEHKDVFSEEPEFANEVYQYAVADLNRNGKYELILSNTGGTGFFTYNRFFEVNDSFDGFTELSLDFPEELSQPDLSFLDSLETYLDSKGLAHYVVRDQMKNGALEFYETLYDLSFPNGQVKLDVIASKSILYHTEQSQKTTCTNAAGQAITEEDYESAVSEHFQGCQKYTTALGWRNASELQKDTEEVRNYLQQSLTQFQFTYEENETFPFQS